MTQSIVYPRCRCHAGSDDTAEVRVHAIGRADLRHHKQLDLRRSCKTQPSQKVASPRAIPDMGSEAMAEPIAYINGKRFSLPTGRAEVTLLQYLRGACAAPVHACLLDCSLEAGTGAAAPAVPGRFQTC